MSLEVGDDKVEFELPKALSYPSSMDQCFSIEAIEEEAPKSSWEEELDELELLLGVDEGWGLDDNVDEEEMLEPPMEDVLGNAQFCNDEVYAMEKVKRERSTPPKVELKSLPSNLKYAFLGDNSSYPIIVNSALDDDQLTCLCGLLFKHRKAIGYTIDEIKGISPYNCTHRINLEDEARPMSHDS